MQDETSYILRETKSMLLERKEVKQGHEMRWLKSSVSSQKASQPDLKFVATITTDSRVKYFPAV